MRMLVLVDKIEGRKKKEVEKLLKRAGIEIEGIKAIEIKLPSSHLDYENFHYFFIDAGNLYIEAEMKNGRLKIDHIRYELSRRQVEHVRKVIEKVVAERFFTEVV